MTLQQALATGMVEEKRITDNTGNTFISLKSSEDPTSNLRVVIRNQKHRPNDFFIVRLYTKEEVDERFEIWTRFNK